MKLTFLKSKLHRAIVTEADLNYEGSISIDPALCRAAGFYTFERVEIYDVTNGSRFATYVIPGKPGQICVNGAAARMVQPGDQIIIAAYTDLETSEVESHEVTVVLVDSKNEIKDQYRERVQKF